MMATNLRQISWFWSSTLRRRELARPYERNFSCMDRLPMATEVLSMSNDFPLIACVFFLGSACGALLVSLHHEIHRTQILA